MFKRIHQILCNHEYEKDYAIVCGKREGNDNLTVKIQPLTCIKCDKHIRIKSVIRVEKDFYSKFNK